MILEGLSRRSDHRADDHADDLPVLGPLVDHDRPVLGVAAARLQLNPVVGRPVKALQRDHGRRVAEDHPEPHV